MLDINEAILGSVQEREGLLKGNRYRPTGVKNFYARTASDFFVYKPRDIEWKFSFHSIIQVEGSGGDDGGNVIFSFEAKTDESLGGEKYMDKYDHAQNFMRGIYHKLSMDRIEATLDISGFGFKGFYRIFFRYGSKQGEHNNFPKLVLETAEDFLKEGSDFIFNYSSAIKDNAGQIPVKFSNTKKSSKPLKVDRVVSYSKQLRR